MFVDSFNGFGGIASKCLNFINEEFPKSSIFTFFPFPFYNSEVISQDIKINKKIFIINGFCMIS